MNRMIGSMMLVAFVGVSAAGRPAYADLTASETAANHEAMAAKYEEQAAAEEVLIQEHVQMKKDYKKKFFINEKVTPASKYQVMERHCDAIIKKARRLEAELLDFAKWHRMSAAELREK